VNALAKQFGWSMNVVPPMDGRRGVWKHCAAVPSGVTSKTLVLEENSSQIVFGHHFSLFTFHFSLFTFHFSLLALSSSLFTSVHFSFVSLPVTSIPVHSSPRNSSLLPLDIWRFSIIFPTSNIPF
jgi:hypothetical protein